jgi:hypothetical protein
MFKLYVGKGRKVLGRKRILDFKDWKGFRLGSEIFGKIWLY